MKWRRSRRASLNWRRPRMASSDSLRGSWLPFDSKVTLGNLITIATLITLAAFGWSEMESNIQRFDKIADEQGPVIQDLRTITTMLATRMIEVERKADGIAGIGRELSEIKGELKGIRADLLRWN